MLKQDGGYESKKRDRNDMTGADQAHVPFFDFEYKP
jgi:hypothetical protein